ncbi:hypothetical protein L210DRAFT_3548129 [Boletus edulis BED1]|uniref:Uncharacterized protein n=1 Tax=Boletus edulis BED1 TaxID=1328754 RepID=A0AAD4BPG8_BOLED|nr:hypothetical protein L210DRAFT_3548129 [Boletus edulis BED1]
MDPPFCFPESQSRYSSQPIATGGLAAIVAHFTSSHGDPMRVQTRSNPGCRVHRGMVPSVDHLAMLPRVGCCV